jgi:hypothetical protein
VPPYRWASGVGSFGTVHPAGGEDLGDFMDNSGWSAGWGTLALVNAGLAQGKGRSGLSWFLLSLLLGPIATFFIVVMSPLAADAT